MVSGCCNPSLLLADFNRGSFGVKGQESFIRLLKIITSTDQTMDRPAVAFTLLQVEFGGVNQNADLSGLMKELIRIREEQTRS
jgi:hypothetical protein